MEKNVFKIALTGGPCAGKSTVLKEVSKYFSNNGYNVIVIDETASKLIRSNIFPGANRNGVLLFQDLVLKKQYLNEKLAYEYVNNTNSDKPVIILCDRGILDNQAYFDYKEDFDSLLKNNNLREIDLLYDYDLVIDLVSTASLMPSKYETDGVRYETKDEAKNVDLRTTFAWIHHPNLKIIKPTSSIDEKVLTVIKKINDYLNGVEPNLNSVQLSEDSDLSQYDNSNAKVICSRSFHLGCGLILEQISYKGDHLYSLTDDNRSKRTLLTGDEVVDLLSKNEIVSRTVQDEINFVYNFNKYKIIKNGYGMSLEHELNDDLVLPNNLILKQKPFTKTRKNVNI